MKQAARRDAVCMVKCPGKLSPVGPSGLFKSTMKGGQREGCGMDSFGLVSLETTTSVQSVVLLRTSTETPATVGVANVLRLRRCLSDEAHHKPQSSV